MRENQFFGQIFFQVKFNPKFFDEHTVGDLAKANFGKIKNPPILLIGEKCGKFGDFFFVIQEFYFLYTVRLYETKIHTYAKFETCTRRSFGEISPKVQEKVHFWEMQKIYKCCRKNYFMINLYET